MLRYLILYPKNIRPVYVHLKTDKVDLKKKPSRKNFFLHFFAIYSSSRHEKRCRMLERLFCLFQCSRNQQCTGRLLKSEIAIGSLFGQIQRTNFFFIEVKTITKSPGNGLAETICLSNLEICIKKAEFL